MVRVAAVAPAHLAGAVLRARSSCTRCSRARALLNLPARDTPWPEALLRQRPLTARMRAAQPQVRARAWSEASESSIAQPRPTQKKSRIQNKRRRSRPTRAP